MSDKLTSSFIFVEITAFSVSDSLDQNDLLDELVRLNYDLEEENVTILAKEDLFDLRIDGITINLTSNQETEVALWVALVLEEHGLVTIQEQESISPRNVKAIAHEEGNKRSLAELDSLLFRRVRTEIERLRKVGTNNARRKLTSIEGSFNTILRLRFKKLLNLASLGQDHDSLQKTLSKEEEWLYIRLYDLFKTWNSGAGSNSGT
ncbi:MAG: hypothetical protein ACXAB7_21720 [Candidatus Kariarchaeaceae archaeon]|jgi:hypothetical protein